MIIYCLQLGRVGLLPLKAVQDGVDHEPDLVRDDDVTSRKQEAEAGRRTHRRNHLQSHLSPAW